MKKLYTVLIILLLVAFLGFHLSKKDHKIVLGFVPENHPEVIAVEGMISKLSPGVVESTRKKIALAIVSNGKFYNVPYKQLVAIAFIESSFRPDLINESGDHGVFQVNWFWHGRKHVKNPKELLNVYKNAEIACKIINENRKMGFDKIASYHSFNKEKQASYQGRLKIALGRI